MADDIKTVLDEPVEYKGWKIHTITLKDIGKLATVFEKLPFKTSDTPEKATEVIKGGLPTLIHNAPEVVTALFEVSTNIPKKQIPDLSITDTLAILNVIVEKNKGAIPYFFQLMIAVSKVELEKVNEAELKKKIEG